MESTKKEKGRVKTRTIKVDTFIKEFASRGPDLGPESLLPQNIPSYLLQPATEIITKFLENPDKTTDNEDDLFSMKVLQEAVMFLMAAKVVIKDPTHPNTFKFHEDEVIDALQAYAHAG